MSTQFEREVKVEAHGKYESFRGNDRVFYKAVGDGLKLENFEIGQSYIVKGYSSESGKTNYITHIVTAGALVPGAPIVTPVENKPLTGRKMSPPTTTLKEERKASGFKERDFVKEAKGKTFSLIVAGLVQGSLGNAKLEDILAKADDLLKGIEDRGYF